MFHGLLLPFTSPGFILKSYAFSGAGHPAHAETGEAPIMVCCKDLIFDIISQLSFFGKLARRQPCCAFGFASPGGLGRLASLFPENRGMSLFVLLGFGEKKGRGEAGDGR